MKQKLTDFYRELERAVKSCGRKPGTVSVLFASKYLSGEQLAEFIDIYLTFKAEPVIIGENRVQAAEEKFSFLKRERPDLDGKYRKVMIGNLQKNKINKALTLFDEIWGMDSPDMAKAINVRARGKKVPVFLEVNISGENSKHGIAGEDADKVIALALKMPNLKLKGLMAMAPDTGNKELVKKVFRQLKNIARRHNLLTSTGMSGDWREAVEAGSDILRIGSLIFNKTA